MSTADTQAEAARRRDEGMNQAAESKSHRIIAGKAAFLDALMRSPDHTGTIDDATDAERLASAFDDNGKWRGTVTRSLSDAGIIEKVDAVQSRRTSRHCGYVTRWRLVDPSAAKVYAERLRAVLSVLSQQEKTDQDAATSGPAIVSFTTPQGATSNGQTV